MELTPEQKKMLEEQKKQCPFCQIIAGKIPSQKVYEDDLLFSVTDINPAAKGHILLFPKEHYPILPLIPPETFKAMFQKAKELSNSVEKGALATGSMIVVANGRAAGQQSAHFMLHIIPREKGDKLDVLNIPEKDVDNSEIIGPLQNNLGIMMQNHLQREGMTVLMEEEGEVQEAEVISETEESEEDGDEEEQSEEEKPVSEEHDEEADDNEEDGDEESDQEDEVGDEEVDEDSNGDKEDDAGESSEDTAQETEERKGSHKELDLDTIADMFK